MRRHEVDEVSWPDSVWAKGWFRNAFEHPDDEHARSALWQEVPGVDLQQVAPVTQFVQALDSGPKIGPAVGGGESRNVFKKDGLRSTLAHLL